jgi:hypothetical protein
MSEMAGISEEPTARQITSLPLPWVGFLLITKPWLITVNQTLPQVGTNGSWLQDNDRCSTGLSKRSVDR